LLAREQQRDVTGTPAKIASSMAGRPSGVPGILMKSWLAGALVKIERRRQRALCRARTGETSSTPSRRPVGAGEDGLEQIAARVRSAKARPKNRSSPDLAATAVLRCRRHRSRCSDRMIEIVGFEVSPVTKARHVAFQSAAVQQIAGDVVEPQALAEIVKLLGGFHRVTFRLDARALDDSSRRGNHSRAGLRWRSIVTSAGADADYFAS